MPFATFRVNQWTFSNVNIRCLKAQGSSVHSTAALDRTSLCVDKLLMNGAKFLLFLIAVCVPSANAQALEPVSANPTVDADRIVLTQEQLREAYAAGILDRPIKSILNVREAMQYGEYRWDDRRIPPGTTWIRVDLSRQLISVFRAGHEIGTAVILYGADGLPTPTGKFSILGKSQNHRSRTYGNAPMPYSLWLTRTGVAIHGSNVRRGFASHGCIGVPTAFAAKLFHVVKAGDQVLVFGTKRTIRKHAKTAI